MVKFSLLQLSDLTGPFKLYVLIMMMLAMLLQVRSQDLRFIRFDRLSIEQGLSQSSVQSIIQDDEGFIWFGTQNGLNRYDGRRITGFQHDPYNHFSMTNSTVLATEKDDEGFLWVGTMGGGLMRYNPLSESFLSIGLHPGPDQAVETTIWSLRYDKARHRLWIGGTRGLYCYDLAGKTAWRIFLKGPGGELLPDCSIMSILVDRNGQVWVSLNMNGLLRFDPESMESKLYTYENGRSGSISSNLTWCLMEDSQGGIWVGSENGLNYIHGDEGKIDIYLAKEHGLADNLVWSLLEDKKGRIWIGTNDGLSVMEKPGGPLITYRSKPNDPFSLSNNVVWSLVEDRSGVIWAGTNDGVNRMSPSRKKFTLYRHNHENPGLFPQKPVSAILEDSQGKLWVGTEGEGLFIMDKGVCRNRLPDGNGTEMKNIGDRIWSLLEDRSGEIWIGTYGNGLFRYNPVHGKMTAYRNDPSDPGSIPGDRVLVLYQDSGGTIWLGTRGRGLARIDRYNGTFVSYLHSETQAQSISSNTVTSILEDSHGHFWVGTFEGGLNLLDRQTGSFTRFSDTLGRPLLAGQSDIWNLTEDKNGTLWAGTSSGLFKISAINPENKTLSFKHYTAADGLAENMILGLLSDYEGNLWISGSRGITKFMPDKLQIRRYDVTDGLQSNEFSQGAFHKGRSGKLYFGGLYGLNSFYPSEIKDDPFVPPVLLTGMMLFYKDVRIMSDTSFQAVDTTKPDKLIGKNVNLIQQEGNYYLPIALNHVKHLELTYNQNVISFEFSALDFFNPPRIWYSCIMEGFEDHWNELGNANRVTYTNLDPGDYIFRVKSTNADSFWNGAELSLAITISPPFWKTNWFLATFSLLSLVVIVLIVFLIVRRQQRKVRLTLAREKEIIELQLKAIRSQVDPHFTFNAINSIGSYIYGESPDKTYDYFTKFTRLIRITLQNAEKIYIPLEEELDFVKTYLDLEKTRFKKKFDYFLKIDPGVDKKILVPKTIIHSHTENAVKHGLMPVESGGKIEIELKAEEGEICILVTDNGIGRLNAAKNSKYSTHRGMQIISQFIEVHNKMYTNKISMQIIDLSDEQGNPAGTRVIIRCPVMHDLIPIS